MFFGWDFDHEDVDTEPTQRRLVLFFFFFLNAPATTEIYTLSLHDALPISELERGCFVARDMTSGEEREVMLSDLI